MTSMYRTARIHPLLYSPHAQQTMSTDTTLKDTPKGTTKTKTTTDENSLVLTNCTNKGKGVKKAQRLRAQIKGQKTDEIAKTVSDEAREQRKERLQAMLARKAAEKARNSAYKFQGDTTQTLGVLVGALDPRGQAEKIKKRDEKITKLESQGRQRQVDLRESNARALRAESKNADLERKLAAATSAKYE